VVLLEPDGQAGEEAPHLPHARLSRGGAGLGEPHRHALHARAVRPAAGALPPHRQPVPLGRGPGEGTRPSSGWRPPAGSRTRSWSSGPGTSRPSLPSRSRVPGASSSRPTPTGPRCSGSAAATTSCSWPTR
jgi:hypothetical protein